ncbi:MAG: hypothetical protein QGH95_01765 [Candidatus Nitrosopelagicus sp.]|jgi:hypothetical protein|nr:hypothetical protein [Candidatus Nitrosopelagicus sp.]
MSNDLKTPGFFIIAILGTIVTAGFFLAFFPTLFKKRINSKSVVYTLVVFDVYGNKTTLNGLRTSFQNKEVALSFAKFYKKEFPLYDFGIIHEINGIEKLMITKHI